MLLILLKLVVATHKHYTKRTIRTIARSQRTQHYVKHLRIPANFVHILQLVVFCNNLQRDQALITVSFIKYYTTTIEQLHTHVLAE